MLANEQTDSTFDRIWEGLVIDGQTPVQNPHGIVLGGQPGAGKSQLIKIAQDELNNNVVVINGDTFQEYHPDFDEIQVKYGKNYVQYTAEFTSKMVERTLKKAIVDKYNVIIEGTFRTAEVPIRTLATFKSMLIPLRFLLRPLLLV